MIKYCLSASVQDVHFPDHYHHFLHYYCAALLDQVVHSTHYRLQLRVFTLVILTSGDRHKEDISVIDFDPRTLQGKPLGEIDHKMIYLCLKGFSVEQKRALKKANI